MSTALDAATLALTIVVALAIIAVTTVAIGDWFRRLRRERAAAARAADDPTRVDDTP